MPLTLADTTAKEREYLEVCMHEAGHAVAAVALGGVIRNAVVVEGRVTGRQGLTTVNDMPHGRDPEIAYAGPFAAGKFRARGRRPTQREMFAVMTGGGRGDAAVLSLAGGEHLGHSIKPLLDRCWPAVIRVGQQLCLVGEVFQEDILLALGISDGGGRTSAQLASLRSGFRAVPPLTTPLTANTPKRAAVPA